MRDRWKLFLLGLAALALLLLYLFWGGPMSDYVFDRRLKTVAAVLVTGAAVSVSSLLFQTLTHNRILTPAVIGFDSLYLLIQGITVFVTGTAKPSFLEAQGCFLWNVLLMIFFSELLYRALFRAAGKHLYFILLAGVVCGMLFRSAFSFFMVLLDPDQFEILQYKMFASFNMISQDLLLLAALLILGGLLYGLRFLPKWDVFLLGVENAYNLGIDTARLQKKTMRLIAVLVAVSTALVGPITFLGLMVVNIAYAVFSSYRHSILLPGSVLVTWLMLFVGLLVVERALSFSTNLTVILNGLGGTYFIYLLLRRRGNA